MMKKGLLSITVVVIIILAVTLCIRISPFPKANKLLKAIQSQDVALAASILAEGVDPNQTDVPPSRLWSIWEFTADRPICYACANGDLEMVKLLIDYGATAEYREYTGWSPLREALFFYDANDLKIVELLLENGADPYNGMTAYEFAEDYSSQARADTIKKHN